jgi:hypothetical protein
VLFANVNHIYKIENIQQNRQFLGEFLVYSIITIIFSIFIVAIIAFPDKNGITLLPSFLCYLAFFGSLLIFMKDLPFNKEKCVSWALVLFIWFIEIFLIMFYAIQIFAKYEISPNLWYAIEIGSFSLSLLFLGIFTGGIVAFSFSPQFKPFNFLNYMFFSDPEDKLLEIALYGSIYVVLISPVIRDVINYFAF